MLAKNPVLWKEVYVGFYKHCECQTTLAKGFVNLLPPCVTSLGINFFDYNDQTGQLNFEELSVVLQERCPHLKKLMLRIALLSDCLPSVIDLCTQFLPNLQVLEFCKTTFSDCPARKDECGSPSKIEVLDITYCHFRDINKSPISKMPNLKKLLLFGMSIDDDWFECDTSFLTQLHMLNLGFTEIGSRSFQAICSQACNLEELYLCQTYVNDKDFNFNTSVFPHLKTVCLKRCSRVTCKSVIFLIQSCKSLENVYVNEDVAASYAKHSFVTLNKCKSGIVKSDGNCYAFHNVDYSWR